MPKTMLHWCPSSLSRLVLAGALVAGMTACDSGPSSSVSFSAPEYPLASENLVANSGLEDTTSLEGSGWDAYTSGEDAQAEFWIDSTEARRGNHSLRVSIAALGDQPYHIEAGPVGVPVEAGETYALVAWAKGPEGSRINFTASLAEEPWTTFGERALVFAGERDENNNLLWEQVAFIFTMPESFSASTIRLPIQMNFPENEGVDIYIDDVQLVPTDPPIQGRVNLVSNGGLEESDTEAVGWVANDGDLVTYSVDSSGEHAFEGNNSLRVVIGDVPASADPWSIETGPNNIPVEEGETYTFSARVKGTPGATANFNVQLQDSPWAPFASELVTVTEEWQLVMFDAVIDSDAIDNYEGPTSQIRLFVQLGYPENSGAEIYIDDMQLLTQGVNIVANGSLEESDTSHSGWGGAGATFDVITDPEEAQDGNNTLRVTIGTLTGDNDPWDVEVGPINIPVEDGETYIFSGWIKGSAGSRATFNVQLPVSPWHTFDSQDIDVTGEWQQVAFEAFIDEAADIDGYDEDSVGQIRLFVHLGYAENSGAEIYLDNFSLMVK